MKMRFILCCAVLVSVLGACGKDVPKLSPAPLEVSIITVKPRNLDISREYIAQTQSSQAVNIQARVSSFLEERFYSEDAMVKAGQVLFRMDPKTFKERLDAANAAMQQYSDLARLRFDGGYTSYSTVQQAEQALVPAQPNLASIRAQVFASAVNIYQSMGGGWVAQADQHTGSPPSTPLASAQPPLLV